MKILVTDAIQIQRLPALKEALAPHDIDWRVRSTDDTDALEREVVDTTIYIGSLFTDGMAQLANLLRLIQCPGAGTENIAMSSLRSDVIVANCYCHGPAIAEYCVMVMLALSRRLVVEDAELRRGRWLASFAGHELNFHPTLAGSTVGIVGAGEIGTHVARLAKALGLRVLVLRRSQTTAAREIDRYCDSVGTGPRAFRDLLHEADFLVLAVPLTAQTEQLVGHDELQQMKPSAFLINVGRAAIVDQHALFNALTNRTIAGAALDVWWRYPASTTTATLPSVEPYHTLDNVIMTPHSSGFTELTFGSRTNDIANNIEALIDGRPLRNVVRATVGP